MCRINRYFRQISLINERLNDNMYWSEYDKICFRYIKRQVIFQGLSVRPIYLKLKFLPVVRKKIKNDSEYIIYVKKYYGIKLRKKELKWTYITNDFFEYMVNICNLKINTIHNYNDKIIYELEKI